MKKVKYLLLLIAFSFILVSRVNAGVATESNLECDTHIDLTKISDGDFDVKMPICELSHKGEKEGVTTGEDFTAVSQYRDTQVAIQQASLSGKDLTTTYVPICAEYDGGVITVTAKVTCTATVRMSTDTVTYAGCNVPTVDEDGNKIECPKESKYYKYGCSKGKRVDSNSIYAPGT